MGMEIDIEKVGLVQILVKLGDVLKSASIAVHWLFITNQHCWQPVIFRKMIINKCNLQGRLLSLVFSSCSADCTESKMCFFYFGGLEVCRYPCNYCQNMSKGRSF